MDSPVMRSLIVELTRISLGSSTGAQCNGTPAAVPSAKRDALGLAAAESVCAALEAKR
jgi:hypothetical protein